LREVLIKHRRPPFAASYQFYFSTDMTFLAILGDFHKRCPLDQILEN